jgi:maltodextrin utilization protein YvdJ
MMENEREYKQAIEEMKHQIITFKNQIEKVEQEREELSRQYEKNSSTESVRAEEAWRKFVSKQRYAPLTPTFGL